SSWALLLSPTSAGVSSGPSARLAAVVGDCARTACAARLGDVSVAAPCNGAFCRVSWAAARDGPGTGPSAGLGDAGDRAAEAGAATSAARAGGTLDNRADGNAPGSC